MGVANPPSTLLGRSLSGTWPALHGTGTSRAISPATSGKGVGEHRRVVAVPVILGPILRVVLPLQPEKFGELGVTVLDLLPGREAVVGEVVASTLPEGAVDGSVA